MLDTLKITAIKEVLRRFDEGGSIEEAIQEIRFISDYEKSEEELSVLLFVSRESKCKIFDVDVNKIFKGIENLKRKGEICRNRRLFGLTQKELGKRVGINGYTISKIEYGSRNPSISLLVRLYTVFEGLKAKELSILEKSSLKKENSLQGKGVEKCAEKDEKIYTFCQKTIDERVLLLKHCKDRKTDVCEKCERDCDYRGVKFFSVKSC